MGHCGIVFVLLCVAVPAIAKKNGGTLHCQKRWVTGRYVTLTFYLDALKFPSECVHLDNNTYFQRSTDAEGTPRVNCTVSNIITPATCSGSFSSGSLGCGCASKNDSYYVFEYNFVAHPDYNGWWSAEVACRDRGGDPVLSFSSVECDHRQTLESSLAREFDSLHEGQRDTKTTLGDTTRPLGRLEPLEAICIATLCFAVFILILVAGIAIWFHKKLGDIDRKFHKKLGDIDRKFDQKLGDIDRKFEEKLGNIDRKFGEKLGNIERKIDQILKF